MRDDQRKLTLSPAVQAFHERTNAALAAFEAASPEERAARLRDLEALKDECITQIERNHDAMRRLLEGEN